MLEFLTAGPNLPFSVALAVMLFMAFVEGIGFLIGHGVFGFLDHLAPDFDLHHAGGAELAGYSLADRFMGWLHFGRVPVLILLVVFLTAFGVAGLALQFASVVLGGALLPGPLAAAVAFPAALPVVRVFGAALAKVLPRDETYVSSQDALIGRVATIVLGEARQGAPAQAKLKDAFGQVQYLMVEPDDGTDAFKAGEAVLLVSRARATYRAIRNTHESLVN
jgi:hypothetical protein